MFFGYGYGFGWLFWIIEIACAAWVIVDILKYQKKMKDNEKLIWIIAAIIFGLLTAIVYYFVHKQK